MIAALPCPQEEQAGSVEQQSPAAAPAAAPAVAKRGRQRREDVTPSWQLALCDAPQHSLGEFSSGDRSCIMQSSYILNRCTRSGLHLSSCVPPPPLWC